ncbi:MAG: DUF4381 domain-containing protein [Desulfuromonadales bacterium]|nr:DUF4381 domain-containing protein [Desulfuromonadales bacterium]
MPAAPMTPESLPLRDIHLPPAISWWPPAPGWWLLLFGVILLIAVGYTFRQQRQRRHLRRLALSQLDELERQYDEHTNPRQLLQGLSRLLRQAAQLHFPQSNCAGLVGEAWLDFLDQRPNDKSFSQGDKSFSQGVGRLLADGPYLPLNTEIDSAALLSLCRNWLKQLPPAPKPQRRPR